MAMAFEPGRQFVTDLCICLAKPQRWHVHFDLNVRYLSTFLPGSHLENKNTSCPRRQDLLLLRICMRTVEAKNISPKVTHCFQTSLDSCSRKSTSETENVLGTLKSRDRSD